MSAYNRNDGWATGGLLVLACFTTMMGCMQKDPDHIIPGHKMVILLTQLHEADAYLGNVPQLYAKPSMDSLGTLAYYTILQKNGYTPMDLRRSLKYYYSHPDSLDAVYKEVVNLLNARVAKLDRLLNQAAGNPGAPPLLYDPAKHDTIR